MTHHTYPCYRSRWSSSDLSCKRTTCDCSCHEPTPAHANSCTQSRELNRQLTGKYECAIERCPCRCHTYPPRNPITPRITILDVMPPFAPDGDTWWIKISHADYERLKR